MIDTMVVKLTQRVEALEALIAQPHAVEVAGRNALLARLDDRVGRLEDLTSKLEDHARRTAQFAAAFHHLGLVACFGCGKWFTVDYPLVCQVSPATWFCIDHLLPAVSHPTPDVVERVSRWLVSNRDLLPAEPVARVLAVPAIGEAVLALAGAQGDLAG